MDTMLASDNPWLKAYFHGKRSRASSNATNSPRPPA
jgi:ABC-type transporter Mla maintaining outer membrane lipid asymmetry ATPase subunit MlaF